MDHDSPKTLAGALRRGLGRGALLARGDPAAPDAVMACLREDFRWDRQVDERAVYLARLVRDLSLPLEPIEALPPSDHLTEILDLLAGTDRPTGEPGPPFRGLPRPYRHLPDRDLLAMLAGPQRSPAVLRELNRRGPQQAVLALADDLSGDETLRPPLGIALERLGAAALPLARAWRAGPGHPMRRTAVRLIAGSGDATDLPALFAEWERLRADPSDRCGYDVLAEGFARIGGPDALAAVPLLRQAWFTPHTLERAAYLEALTILDPVTAGPFLVEGLWDCESRVRLFAAGRVPLNRLTRGMLTYLRDDRLETADVQDAAANALDPAGPAQDQGSTTNV